MTPWERALARRYATEINQELLRLAKLEERWRDDHLTLHERMHPSDHRNSQKLYMPGAYYMRAGVDVRIKAYQGTTRLKLCCAGRYLEALKRKRRWSRKLKFYPSPCERCAPGPR